MPKATSIVISLFVSSPAKFVVTAGEDGEFQAIDNLMCFSADFKDNFQRLYDKYNTIEQVYLIGTPEDYVQHFYDIVKGIVSDKVQIVKAG